MKKIFMLAVVFAAVSMVACGGNKEKKANAAEGEAAQTEVVDEQACCGECEAVCVSPAKLRLSRLRLSRSNPGWLQRLKLFRP